MKKGQTQNKYLCVNLDRLELTYELTPDLRDCLSNLTDTLHYDCFDVKRTTSYTYVNEFELWSDFYRDGETVRGIFCYLKFGSPNPNRPHLYCYVENNVLYDELLHAIYYIESTMGLHYLRISKIDIAIDFNFAISSIIRRIYRDENVDLIINRKRISGLEQKVRSVGFFASNNPRKSPLSNPTMYVKNSDGTLLLRTYNKKKEIEEESQKDYIEASSGFSKIYRVEVSCQNHKQLAKSLAALGISDEQLHEKFLLSQTQLALFHHLSDRLIRVSKGRKSQNLIDYILDMYEHK